MLVILTEQQIISSQKVCQNCLLADRAGSPRWHHGNLGCGHYLGKQGQNQLALYECQMGFKLANIE